MCVGWLRRRSPLRSPRFIRPMRTVRRPTAGWSALLPHLPQPDDVRFTHRWAGAIDTNTRFCAHWGGRARRKPGRLRQRSARLRGAGATSGFAADACLDLLTETHAPNRIGDGFGASRCRSPEIAGPCAGIQLRWSLTQPTTLVDGALCRCAPTAGSGIRFLTAHKVRQVFGLRRAQPARGRFSQ